MPLTILPTAGQSLNITRDPIRNNFQSIQNSFGGTTDHVDFGLGNQGKHAKITIPESAADPATAINECALYTKQSVLSGLAELFIRKENNGDIFEFTSCLAANDGWTRLPSGILLKWGRGAGHAGLFAYTYAAAPTIPIFTTVFVVIVTPFYIAGGDGNAFVRVNNFNLVGFETYQSARTTTATDLCPFAYLAIGI